MKRQLAIYFSLLSFAVSAQSPPWNNALRMAWSADGTTFGTSSIFQDSSGVPCVIRWKGDTLAAVFQWFRQPNPSPSWDRVAVKFSYDNGMSWTNPMPCVFNGLPVGYQRPFDPALTTFAKDSLRMYFSSSASMSMFLDSTVNTYSAKSADGINYFFESLPRVDVVSKPVIDPTVIFFNNSWHYIAPIGTPQQGAYHYVSPNAVNFSSVVTIPSDNQHNWTGNYMLDSPTELRFYGSGPNIWFNSSPNGGVWNGFVSTNIQGGDPSVLKISVNNYLMVYVGPHTLTTGMDAEIKNTEVQIFPNPVSEILNVQCLPDNSLQYSIFNSLGLKTREGDLQCPETINVGDLPSGIYFLLIVGDRTTKVSFIKE